MRTFHSDLQTSLVQPVVRFVYLVKIQFDEGDVAWNTSYNTITYDSVEYDPVGALGSISGIKESSGIKIGTLTLGVSGVDPTIVALFLGANYFNRKVFIYYFTTDETLAFKPNTVRLLFKGSIDNINGIMGNEASFSISVKSRLADWERTRNLKYSDSDQQRLYAGDRGLEYIPQLSQKKIIWPKAAFLPDVRDYKPKYQNPYY